MVHIQWKDRYNINFMEIDEQHKVLLDLLNELIDLVGERGDPEVVSDIFHRLCQYALTHFSVEEAYMAAGKYPQLAKHQAEHGTFIQKLLELNQTYDPADPHLLEETVDFLKHWYLDHILNSDTKYVPFLKAP
jgi:hemerythrin-like metal-binding protein